MLTISQRIHDAMARHRILIVDDVLSVCQDLQQMLAEDFDAEISTELRKSVSSLPSSDYDLLISGLVMSELSGFELLREIRRSGNDMPIVMVTSWGNERCAAEALRLGATKFLCQPVSKDELVKAVRDAIENPRGIAGSDLDKFHQLGELVTGDSAMMDLFSLARRVAVTDSRVLIQGATGTGKRLFARAIHSISNRRANDLVELNCAAIPEALIESELFGHQRGAFTGANSDWEGRFEEAGKGTLFLDEIGELGLTVQSKLLQVLQSGEFRRVGGKGVRKNRARVIAATNRDLF
ncbi:MAG: sigma 54-interacting transcriptional regulator, partial [Acidobacteria bacterium]|nr:sigma 54-interacting transcriptional regulator [Acidobacteriota bacterium]